MALKHKKRWIIIAGLTAIIAFAVLFTLSAKMYNAMFGRVITPDDRRRTPYEFKNLEVVECTFASNHGQKLAGYTYTKPGLDPAGVIIIAHGLGNGGQCVYMDAADYFTSHGYIVFSYDATAMDKSEGSTAYGMEQGVIDLSYAINYVEQDSVMKKYPLMLFGHSWGAYSVCTVLNVHPEIKAVAAVSGFNATESWLKYAFSSMGIIGALPTFDTLILEKIKFGKYAGYTALSGFAKSKAAIMIIQSFTQMQHGRMTAKYSEKKIYS